MKGFGIAFCTISAVNAEMILKTNTDDLPIVLNSINFFT